MSLDTEGNQTAPWADLRPATSAPRRQVQAVPQIVLIVDADRKALAHTCRIMSDAGYWTTTASSFEEAKRRLALTTPDLLITAVRLGTHNGLHLLVRNRMQFPEIPAIVTHVAPDPVLEAEATALNATYLITPLTRETLLTVARALLSGSPLG
jgi:DNA-binding response OmpR family regulator